MADRITVRTVKHHDSIEFEGETGARIRVNVSGWDEDLVADVASVIMNVLIRRNSPLTNPEDLPTLALSDREWWAEDRNGLDPQSVDFVNNGRPPQ